MKTFPTRKSLLFTVATVLTLVSQSVLSQSKYIPLDTFSPDTILVQFKPGTTANTQAAAHSNANSSVGRRLYGTEVLLMRVPPGSAEKAIAAYRNNPNIAYAEKNYRRVIYLPTTLEGSESISTLTFDNFGEQWNLHNLGQEFGLTLNFNGNYLYPSYEGAPYADINAPEAWDITHGDSSVTIAILDTGIACDHLDLDGKCQATVNFVDDKSSPPEDVLGHGTHVAGIAAASTDNGVGIAGVGWNSSVASLKVCWEDYSYALYDIVLGVCDDADVIEAINHAVGANYKIISMSFAGTVSNPMLEEVIDSAWSNGVVMVAAAGNIYTDDIMYPAGYANVISVGATDHHDNLSAFSNHGSSVSVLAPGSHIVSTVPGQFCGQASGVQSDCYDTKSGTSMAAPHVAGLAALIMAAYPTATNADIRRAIETTADATGAMGQNMFAWSANGRINMQAALATDPTTPGTTNFVVTQQPPVVSTVNLGKGNKIGRAEVTIVDNFGNAVVGAEVDGEFSNSFAYFQTQTSNASGVVVFETDRDSPVKGGVSFTFCVKAVRTTLTFSPSANDCATF